MSHLPGVRTDLGASSRSTSRALGSIALGLSVLLLTGACRSAPDETEVPSEPTVVHQVQVVDSKSKEPLAGAIAYATEEIEAPISGEIWYRAKATAQADGVAHLAVPETTLAQSQWYFFDAPGYAAVAEFGRQPPERVELTPGVDVTFRLVDEAGAPVVGAYLGWMLGCGHAPDMRWGYSNDSGELTLTDIDPVEGDLWLVGENVLSDYAYATFDDEVDGRVPSAAADPSDRTATVICQPGVPLRGRVVDGDGLPLANHFVGSRHRHRGPWVPTGPNGEFHAPGLEPGGIWVLSPNGEYELTDLELEQYEEPVTLVWRDDERRWLERKAAESAARP